MRVKASARAGAQAFGLAFRAGRGLAVAQALLAVVSGAGPVALALLTKLALDRLAAGEMGSTLGVAAALAVAGVTMASLPHLMRYVSGQWGRAVSLAAQTRLFHAVNGLPGLSTLEDAEFRDRLRLAEQGGRGSPVAVASNALEFGRGTVSVLGFIATLATLNPWMVVIVALAAVPAAWAELGLSRRRAEMLWRMSPTARREIFYGQLLTGLPAAKEIRLFGLGELFGLRMLSGMRAVHAEHRRIDRRQLRVQAVLALVGAVVAGGGLVWAIHAATTGRLSIGDVALFIAAVAGVQAAVSGMVGNVAEAHQAIILFGHYRAVTELRPDLPVPAKPVAVRELRSRIEFRDVWFRYSRAHPWVLKGINMTLNFGETSALVGLNGSGKSTVVKLLLRFYDPVRGSIRWDGVDLCDMAPDELRGRIGAVFQDFMCYDLSAAENIGIGDLAALTDRDRVVSAARRAGAHEALSALPKGYDTLLTRIFSDAKDGGDANTGVLLSGGQWQRVAIARAFLRTERDLLILDEPSSGLDAEAEHDVHTRLHTLRRGKTSLLISHRLGAIRDADRILVLADGRIAESGDHDGLMAAGGEYARLFSLQARGYAPVAPVGVGNPMGYSLEMP